MVTYKQKIYTVYDDKELVGYIARRHNIFTTIQGQAMGWCICKSDFVWQGNYPTRKEASQALKHEI